MKIPVSELEGIALDWATCKATGIFTSYPHMERRFCKSWQASCPTYFVHPSSDWSHGGPIIEREGINCNIQLDEPGFKHSPERRWYAQVDRRSFTAYGPTPLVAAMRCYVASKLGESVDVPDERRN